MSSVEINEIDDEHEHRNDFRRANGAPLVSDPDNPDKSLRYRRPSGYGKPLDDESALTEWRIWKAMQGVARSQALQIKVAACKEEDRPGKKALREEALDKGAANEAADSGTGLHAMTARMEDPDDHFEPPEQYADDLEAYAQALTSYGLVSKMVEVHMVNDAYKAAGTADRIYETTKPLTSPDGRVWPPGTLILGDIKTGKKLDFSLPGYCVQCAIYADGCLYDVINDVRLPTPEINPMWAVLVHLPVGQASCEVLWINIGLGLEGAYLSFQVKEWQNAWKAGRDGHEAVVVPTPPDEPVPDDDPCPHGAATPEACALCEGEIEIALAPWLFERLAQIGAHPEARKELIRRWPPGLPTPKQGIDYNRIDELDQLFILIETRYSLGFVPDPRKKANLRPLTHTGAKQ